MTDAGRPKLEIRWTHGKDSATAPARDPSLGGLFIETDRPLEDGTLLSIEIADGDDKIVMDARVIMVRAKAEGVDAPAGMGVRFLDLPEETIGTLRRILARRLPREETVLGVGAPAEPPPVRGGTIHGIGAVTREATTPGVAPPAELLPPRDEKKDEEKRESQKTLAEPAAVMKAAESRPRHDEPAPSSPKPPPSSPKPPPAPPSSRPKPEPPPKPAESARRVEVAPSSPKPAESVRRVEVAPSARRIEVAARDEEPAPASAKPAPRMPPPPPRAAKPASGSNAVRWLFVVLMAGAAFAAYAFREEIGKLATPEPTATVPPTASAPPRPPALENDATATTIAEDATAAATPVDAAAESGAKDAGVDAAHKDAGPRDAGHREAGAHRPAEAGAQPQHL